MSEAVTQQHIRLALGTSVTLWRNNTGAYKDESGRLVRYGLCTGSSDLIGFVPVKITPEMVGHTIPVFTAIEVKHGRGKPTPEQTNFISHIQRSGGYAGVAYSVEDALRICGL
jgi:VRR-NUC domain